MKYALKNIDDNLEDANVHVDWIDYFADDPQNYPDFEKEYGEPQENINSI